MKRRTKSLLLVAGFGLFACAARAENQAFAAIPQSDEALYRVDFSAHFFSSPEEEVADRSKLEALYAALEEYKGKMAKSAGALSRALALYEQATISYSRHENYLFLRAALNTEDRASIEADDAIIAGYESRTAFVRQELGEIDDATLDKFIRRRPELAAYEFAVKDARRFRHHQLPLSEEELLQKQSPEATGWQYDLYERLISRADFGAVESKRGSLDVLRARREIASDPDARVRKAGFEKLYAGFAADSDLYAFVLRNLARARNQIARLHRFEDDTQASYFKSFWSKEEVSNLLTALAKHAEVYKSYQRERAQRAGRLRHIKDVNVWDVGGALGDLTPPKFSIDRASKAIIDATAPLGNDFKKEMTALLDPHNGRLDITPGPHRKSGGFSLGFIGVDSVFFTGGYHGDYNDMRVLAHEATHAVHRQLMTDHGVSPLYAAGPSYLFESFAAFSELLLADHLYAAAADPSEKRFFLEQFLEGKGTVMFVAGPEAALEQAVYEAQAAGKTIDAKTLDALTLETYSRYSIWPQKDGALKSRWAMIPLMYEDPFYDINYVYAGLLALVYYDLYQHDPKGFAQKYQALMENGFDAAPDQLLRRTLDIDLNDSDALVAHAMRVLEEKIDEFKANDQNSLKR